MKKRTSLVKKALTVLMFTTVGVVIGASPLADEGMFKAADTVIPLNAKETLGQISPNVFYLQGLLSSLNPKLLTKFRHAAKVAHEEHRKILLVIDSPGGIVNLMKKIQATFEDYPGTIDTLIDGLAASAAAEIWSFGADRYMRDGSELLYHSVQIAGMSMKELMDIDAILHKKGIKLALSTPDEVKTKIVLSKKERMAITNFVVGMTMGGVHLSSTKDVVKFIVENYTSLDRELHLLVQEAMATNQDFVAWTHRILKKNGITMTKEDINHKLFGDFYYETPLTKEMVLEYGLTTQKGVPSPDVYE